MNSALNKQLNGLLTSTGLTSQKASLVLGFTGGRSESRAALTDAEALEMIAWLKTQGNNNDDAANKMRRKIISYAHQLHWYLPNTQTVDMARIDGWCTTYGYGHKKLNDYTYNELPKLVSQFRLVFKSFLIKF